MILSASVGFQLLMSCMSFTAKVPSTLHTLQAQCLSVQMPLFEKIVPFNC